MADIGQYVKITSVLVMIIVFLFGFIIVLIGPSILKRINKSRRKLLTMTAVGTFVAGMFCCLELLLGLAYKTWSLGNTACQVFGMGNLILTSGATWILAIAAMDRYYRFFLPADHSSTFSQKNLNILVSGLYVLITLVATGPLYGLGGYSHLRGHFTMTVYANSTIENISDIQKETVERYYANLLVQMVMSQKFKDPIAQFSDKLDTEYGVVMSRWSAVDRGTVFILRAKSNSDAALLWKTYEEDKLTTTISNHLWRGELLQIGKINNIIFQAELNNEEFQSYLHIYIPAQGLGICTVDYTSPHVHAAIWSGYQLFISTVLPYLIILITYIIIFFKNPYAMTAFDKNISTDDITVLQIFSSSSTVCCFFAVLYYGFIISSANGITVSEDLIFAVTFLYYGSNMAVVMCILLYGCACVNFMKSKCKSCMTYSRDSISNEITEIKMKQLRTMTNSYNPKKLEQRHV